MMQEDSVEEGIKKVMCKPAVKIIDFPMKEKDSR